jgi:hypothetical protein
MDDGEVSCPMINKLADVSLPTKELSFKVSPPYILFLFLGPDHDRWVIGTSDMKSAFDVGGDQLQEAFVS